MLVFLVVADALAVFVVLAGAFFTPTAFFAAVVAFLTDAAFFSRTGAAFFMSLRARP